MSNILNPDDLLSYMAENHIEGELLFLDVPTPTVQAAARAVRADVNQIVKTILFLVRDESVAAIACGTAPVDRRLIARHFGVGLKQVKLARAPQVLQITGYAAGAVPPFGHLHSSRFLLDPRVLLQDTVYAGGGAENALLRLPPQSIQLLTGAEVIDLIIPAEFS
jgi:prolyl-tRNA editing enzyme YbaK/EbsC (Cys-tRNA(Pro) deacylase)